MREITPAGPVYLETNTLPGLTVASFVPQQLGAAEIPLRSFVGRQFALARRRQQRAAAADPAFARPGPPCI